VSPQAVPTDKAKALSVFYAEIFDKSRMDKAGYFNIYDDAGFSML